MVVGCRVSHASRRAGQAEAALWTLQSPAGSPRPLALLKAVAAAWVLAVALRPWPLPRRLRQDRETVGHDLQQQPEIGVKLKSSLETRSARYQEQKSRSPLPAPVSVNAEISYEPGLIRRCRSSRWDPAAQTQLLTAGALTH